MEVENSWFVILEDEQIGPMSLEELFAIFMNGSADGASFVWRSDFKDWRPANQIPELKALLANLTDQKVHEITDRAASLAYPPDIIKQEQQSQQPRASRERQERIIFQNEEESWGEIIGGWFKGWNLVALIFTFSIFGFFTMNPDLPPLSRETCIQEAENAIMSGTFLQMTQNNQDLVRAGNKDGTISKFCPSLDLEECLSRGEYVFEVCAEKGYLNGTQWDPRKLQMLQDLQQGLGGF